MGLIFSWEDSGHSFVKARDRQDVGNLSRDLLVLNQL